MLGVDSCFYDKRCDQTNGSTLGKLILFEKSRVELEFVFSIFMRRVRKFLKGFDLANGIVEYKSLTTTASESTFGMLMYGDCWRQLRHRWSSRPGSSVSISARRETADQ